MGFVNQLGGHHLVGIPIFRSIPIFFETPMEWAHRYWWSCFFFSEVGDCTFRCLAWPKDGSGDKNKSAMYSSGLTWYKKGLGDFSKNIQGDFMRKSGKNGRPLNFGTRTRPVARCLTNKYNYEDSCCEIWLNPGPLGNFPWFSLSVTLAGWKGWGFTWCTTANIEGCDLEAQ